MKNHWLAALLCIVFAFAATGCGNPRSGGGEKRRYTSAQTGTNIPRWQSDTRAGREARSRQRTAKARRDAKKPKAEKPKRERQERRRRASDEEVITRGGFR